eukprot:gene6437-7099_t
MIAGAPISFLVTAVLDIYNLNGRVKGDLPGDTNTMQDLIRWEARICEEFNLKNKNIFHDVKNSLPKDNNKPNKPIRWRCKVRFNPDDPFDERYKLQFLPPTIEEAVCLVANEIGFERFLFVELSGIAQPFATSVPSDAESSSLAFRSQFANQFWAGRKLFENGISFGGINYRFYGGEIDNSKKKKFKKRSEDDDDDDDDDGRQDGVLSCWFYTEDFPATSYGAQNRPMTIIDARNWLGLVTELAPGKCNARLKLGFSPIGCNLTVDENMIHLVDDIHGSGDYILTDGCGLISIDLARLIPYGVSNGQHAASRGENMPAPAIIQVRCSSALGLFKGCLVVTHDCNLCPKRSIIFRKSMKKAEPFPGRRYDPECVIGVVNTFEHPEIWKGGKTIDMANHYIHLSRSLVMLLNHLEVPPTFFEELMREEVCSLTKALSKRESAYSLVRQSLFFADPDDDDVDESCDEDVEDNYSCVDSYCSIVNTGQSSNSSYRLSTAELARNFLISGHGLEEPFLRNLLGKLQLKKAKLLQRCNLRLGRAVYLVGAPDVYNCLQPEEVFVSLPIDHDNGQRRGIKVDKGYIAGQVIVTRHPMYHPGDIRVFQAKYCEKLAELAEHTNGGVIFFSTLGDRAPADMMSGGDYDGDQFVVIYSNDPDLMQVRETKPYEEPKNVGSPDSASGSVSSLCKSVKDISFGGKESFDEFGWDMFRGLLRAAQTNFVGRYSHAWLCWADKFSPKHTNALKSGYLAAMALDAPKTGKLVPYRGDILSSKPPHYLALSRSKDGAKPPRCYYYISKSVLGTLFDMVKPNEVFANTEAQSNEGMVIDFDLLYVDTHSEWDPDNLLLRNHGIQEKLRGYKSLGKYCGTFYERFPEYKEQLEVWKDKIESFRGELSEIYKTTRQKTIGNRIAELFQLHEQFFEKEAMKFASKHGLSDDTARHRVAGFVYIATYYLAMRKRNSGVLKNEKLTFALSYCWHVCGGYLHENKRNRLKFLYGQPKSDPLPKSELPFI